MLSCALVATQQFLKKAIVLDDQSCLSIFIDQADFIIKATWDSRRHIEDDPAIWTLIGGILSSLGREITKAM
jgi:hypothetical protein